MTKSIITIVLGAALGSGIIFVFQIFFPFQKSNFQSSQPVVDNKISLIGFLPYWQLAREDRDHSKYINNISYFGLTINNDGSLRKLDNPTESEPGWLALKSGKADNLLSSSKKNGMKTSLVVFGGDQEGINILMSDPIRHADKLLSEVSPILNEYSFDDLNLDIESFSVASEEARMSFTKFTKRVREGLKKKNSKVTLSIDVSPTALIKPYLIDVSAISEFVDKVIFMTYDFHYQGSFVTGAVAPVNGALVSAEFDVETSIKEALAVLPREKVILGVPLYGYEWETLRPNPNSAVIPGSGITASNERVETFLSECASCEAKFDEVSKESYLVYKDSETDTYHQIFYPDKKVMEEKVKLMEKYDLGGIALWALGYEGKDILDPLSEVKRRL